MWMTLTEASMTSGMKRRHAYRLEAGLTPAIVEQLSKEKHDPAWMEQFRLESLQIYNETDMPNWGPPIDGLNMDNIVTYVRPNTNMKAKCSEVPQDIKDTFETAGHSAGGAEVRLAGVGAQYDSELVYHNVRRRGGGTGRGIYGHGKRPDAAPMQRWCGSTL